jgi:hypothetical protein
VGQEPPETTGAGVEGATAAGCGTCDGACRPPPAPDDAWLDTGGSAAADGDRDAGDADCEAAAAAWAWKEWAVTAVIAPATTMAPPIIQRVTRETRARPYSRASSTRDRGVEVR